MGAVVIGVDIRQYFASLHRAAQRADAPCQMIAADFESLSHQVQKQIGMSEYHVPVLVGYSSGATVVYAALVQSPPGTFAGALSLGFCADQDFAGAALCPGSGPALPRRTRSTSWCSSPQPLCGSRGSRSRGRRTRSATRTPRMNSPRALPAAQVVKLPLVGHGFSVERNWMPQFRDAYAQLTAHVRAAAAGPAGDRRPAAEEVHASGTRR